jgi:hypothetical protein
MNRANSGMCSKITIVRTIRYVLVLKGDIAFECLIYYL